MALSRICMRMWTLYISAVHFCLYRRTPSWGCIKRREFNYLLSEFQLLRKDLALHGLTVEEWLWGDMEIPLCLVWRRRKISVGGLRVLRNTLPAVYFLVTSGPPKFNEPLYRLSELFLSKEYWRAVTCWPGALPNERVSFKFC